MKMLWRCGFAVLLLLGLAIEATHGRRNDASSDAGSILVAGLHRLNVRTERSSEADIVTGWLASCDQPVRALLLPLGGAGDGGLRDFRSDDPVVRYIYMGSVEDDRDRAVVPWRSIWAQASFAVGLRRTRPPADVVVIVLPRTCPGLAELDWTALSPAD